MGAAAQIGSVDLAKYILARKAEMPHLKLQKLVYYVQAWHLAYFEKQLIRDDFKAWVHGPVCTEIWHAFKDPRSRVFNDVSITVDEAKAIKTRVESAINRDQLALINDVLREYGPLSAYELEGLTHSELPWREARHGIPPDESSNKVISKNTMLRFYRDKLYSV